MSVNPYEPSRIPEPLVAAVVEPPREIEFELTLDDYVAFNLDHAKRSSFHKVAIGCFFMASALAVPAAIAVVLLTADNAAELAMPAIGIGAIILLALAITAAWNYFHGSPTFLSGIALRLMFLRGDISSLIGRYSLSVTPEGILERAPKSEHRFAMSAVQTIVVAPQHLYVYVSPLQAFIIPKRAFVEPQAAESFVAMLQQLSRVTAIQSK